MVTGIILPCIYCLLRLIALGVGRALKKIVLMYTATISGCLGRRVTHVATSNSFIF